ncbi:hypothetical protein E3U55_08145 [Filobacillus milosensis]|uniref:Uncharacterized protein n=1 Tax=Filobacillus milosensis TaxID=94137 RepID=A0A4Y8IKW8_9BACI|nr:hypothetical protein [Filobacillus milosensis]TFB21786.1 hypothetical protein E3U55_08145 [Filobacillus milosensis]
MKLEDENGEEVSYRNLHTNAKQEDDSFGFSVPGGGETITVTLSNLLFHVNLDETLTINIEE